MSVADGIARGIVCADILDRRPTSHVEIMALAARWGVDVDAWGSPIVEAARAIYEPARTRRKRWDLLHQMVCVERFPLADAHRNIASMIARGLIVAAIVLVTAPVAAQPDHVLLARSCISERGFRVNTDDCAAIYLVAQARMERRGETFREAIVALAPRLHHGRISARLWLLDISADCHRPRGIGATWDRPRGDEPSRREACEATMAEATALLDGTRALVCSAPPTAWGSTQDLARRRAAGYRWRAAVCEGAVFANHFGTLMRPVPVDEE